MIIHHMVVIVALEVGVHTHAGTFYMAVLLWNEYSTLFLNLRYFLLYGGYASSKMYYYNGVCLGATFLVFRVVAISFVLGHACMAWWELAIVEGLLWSRPTSDRILFGGLTSLLIVHWCLNFHWFLLVCGHIRRGHEREKLKTLTKYTK
jgi:hypothetical protein